MDVPCLSCPCELTYPHSDIVHNKKKAILDNDFSGTSVVRRTGKNAHSRYVTEAHKETFDSSCPSFEHTYIYGGNNESTSYAELKVNGASAT